MQILNVFPSNTRIMKQQLNLANPLYIGMQTSVMCKLQITCKCCKDYYHQTVAMENYCFPPPQSTIHYNVQMFTCSMHVTKAIFSKHTCPLNHTHVHIHFNIEEVCVCVHVVLVGMCVYLCVSFSGYVCVI